MGLLDGFEDPLSEVGEALEDLGVPGANDEVDRVTEAIQSAIDANGGLPEPTMRVLFRVDPTCEPVQAPDAQDIVSQAGHVIDGLGGLGFGSLGAAILNENLIQGPRHEKPVFWVTQMTVEEGLSETWRCEMELLQPTQALVSPLGAPLGLFDYLTREAEPDRTGDAVGNALSSTPLPLDSSTPGTLAQNVANAFRQGLEDDAEEWLVDKLKDRAGDAAAMRDDAANPDALDRTKLPLAHMGPLATPIGLGDTCRVSIARRFPSSYYTLNERWFTGIVTALEDVGASGPLRVLKVVIEPRLARLRLRKRYRAFQNKSALRIVRDLLIEHGVYPESPADTDEHALSLQPGGIELFGPIGVPDALNAAVNKIAGAVPGSDAAEGLLAEDVDGWTPDREWCVQYGETDLDFIERLLAEEGLTYFFEHIERRETLVIADDPRLAGTKTLTATRLPLTGRPAQPIDATMRQQEWAWDLAVARKMVPSGVTLRDRQYTRPHESTDLMAGKSLAAVTPGGLSSLGTLGGLEQMANQVMGMGAELGRAPGTEDYAGPEAQVFEWPTHLPFAPTDADSGLYDAWGGAPLGQLRLEGLRARGAVLRGHSSCTVLTPAHNVRLGGMGFDVLHKPTGRPQRLLVTRVRHVAGRPSVDGGHVSYSNEFEAVHLDLRWRPEPRPKPRIHGVQTATVVDAQADDDVRRDVVKGDALWRVRVRFRWDRGTRARAPTSGWLRFAQPFSGAGFGVLFAPRLGTEVVVGFEEGDPDRPVVLGALYNDYAKGPIGTYHPLRTGEMASTEAARIDAAPRMVDSGFRSRTFGAEPAPDAPGNRLWLDDQAGQEEVHLIAQKDHLEVIGDDHVTTIVGSSRHTVDGEQNETVGGKQTVRARAPKGETPGRKKTVDGDEKVEIGTRPEGAEPMKMRAHVVREDDRLKVGEDREIMVMRTDHAEVGGEGAPPGDLENAARDLRIAGAHAVRIEGDDLIEVFGDRRIHVKQAYTLTAAKVDMKTPSDAPIRDGGEGGEATGGMVFDEEGASMTSTGAMSVEADRLRCTSDGDVVRIRGEKRVWLRGEKQSILLDAEDGTIAVSVDSQAQIRIEAGASAFVMDRQSVTISTDGAPRWSLAFGSEPPALTARDVADVTLAAEGELSIHGAEVRLQEAGATPPEDG